MGAGKHIPDTNRVLITGAAGGLGKAMAVECASRGWDLFLTVLSDAGLETLANGLTGGYGVQVRTHACDLTDSCARSGLIERIRSENLRFSALINVAGVDYEGPFAGLAGEQIRTILRLNNEATLDLTHALLAYRAPLAPFRIINVASLAAYTPMPVKATYAASKRFLLDFSLALREELRDLGATVTVLCPAGMPTNADCIRGIEAQGWMGFITTQDVGAVAYQTIKAAMEGKAVVIPGLANRVIQALGALVPASLAARLVGRRWKAAQQKWVSRPADSVPLSLGNDYNSGYGNHPKTHRSGLGPV